MQEACQSPDSVGNSTPGGSPGYPLLRHPLDPVADQPDGPLVDDVRGDVRHAAEAEAGHPVVDHRPVRVAGHQDPRVLQLELALTGLHADDTQILQWQRGEQLELGVPAAPLAVAVTAVRVEVSPGAGVD